MRTLCTSFAIVCISAFQFFSVSAICLAQPPGNDNCSGNFQILALPWVYEGSTVDAITDYGLECPDPATNDVIFTLILPEQTIVTASMCTGTDFDAQLYVFTGVPCPGTLDVGCDYNSCGPLPRPVLTFTALANVAYYIIVAGNSNSFDYAGNYRLTITGEPPPPVNDSCPGTLVTSLPYSDSGSTVNAEDNFDYSCTVGVPDVSDVIYHLSLPECYEVTASLCGSNFNTQLLVRSQEPCPGVNAQVCNDDFCGEQSQVTFVAHGGWNYFLIVDGVGETGDYVFNMSGTPLATPTNDVCPGTLISSLPFTDTGNTGCAVNDYAYACPVADHREVVYTLNVPQSGMVTASLCGSDYNSMIVVRTGGDCPGVQQITCNDDFCGQQSEVSFYASAGVNYYLFVDGVGGYGNYVLNVTMPGQTPPPAVEGLIAMRSAASQGLVLIWPPSEGADGYYVFRGDTSSFPLDDDHLLAVVTGTTYTDVYAFENGTLRRFYVVTAVSNP